MLPLFDNVPTRRFPVVTVALIAANLAIYVWEQGAQGARVVHYAFYPCAVEGPCTALAQTWLTLHAGGVQAASVPNVGASGAIAGVLGAYIVLLPHARVVTFWFLSSSGRAGRP